MNAKNLIFALIILSAIGCGLMAGVFFAFSTFVMQGLAKLPVSQSIPAMQSINAYVPHSVFGASFIITPLICLITLIATLIIRPQGLSYIIAGTIIYLVGSLAVTMIYNIPFNNVLAAVHTTDADSAEQWLNFYSNWMIWNHVRAIGAGAAAISYAIALFH